MSQDVTEQALLTIISQYSVLGATMPDAQWEKTRDELLEKLGSVLDSGRSNLRAEVMKSMLRTSEEE